MDLPLELQYHIFKFLSGHDLAKIQTVCKTWKTITDDEKLWQQIVKIVVIERIKDHERKEKESLKDTADDYTESGTANKANNNNDDNNNNNNNPKKTTAIPKLYFDLHKNQQVDQSTSLDYWAILNTRLTPLPPGRSWKWLYRAKCNEFVKPPTLKQYSSPTPKTYNSPSILAIGRYETIHGIYEGEWGVDTHNQHNPNLVPHGFGWFINRCPDSNLDISNNNNNNNIGNNANTNNHNFPMNHTNPFHAGLTQPTLSSTPPSASLDNDDLFDPFRLLFMFNNNRTLQHSKCFYEGSFHHGALHGRGRFLLDQIFEYRGYFKNNYFHGRGLMLFAPEATQDPLESKARTLAMQIALETNDDDNYERATELMMQQLVSSMISTNNNNNSTANNHFSGDANVINNAMGDLSSASKEQLIWTAEMAIAKQGTMGRPLNWATYNRANLSVFHPDESYLSAEFYDGEWFEGMYDGYGILGRFDGDYFVGQFSLSSKMLGAFRWASGTCYSGAWRSGAPNGQGEYRWLDGRSYVGEWSFNTKQGKGVYLWSDGSKYEGEWDSGMREGRGRMTWAKEGITHEGEWRQDVMIGEASEEVARLPYHCYFSEDIMIWNRKYQKSVEEQRLKVIKYERAMLQKREEEDKDTFLGPNWRDPMDWTVVFEEPPLQAEKEKDKTSPVPMQN